ncbi:hypothetical protein L6452_36465 [Arctium lappa]|uniref:Uncharacterized protein n=1 Tax=Arctium lappa TaxID=4217 RepID=A0ACB8Y996_ARCLA|nr:hypothetical protein L6452_36465 [Arctium lappa]
MKSDPYLKHIEVWIRLHLESRSSLATWTMVLPNFMYYIAVIKDLSYVTGQCSGEQGSVGFPVWGTVNTICKDFQAYPAAFSRKSAIAEVDRLIQMCKAFQANLAAFFRRILKNSPNQWADREEQTDVDTHFEECYVADRASNPFFCGSPPSRASNPLIQDAQFVNEKPWPLSTVFEVLPSSSAHGSYARVKFGQMSAAVRVEGFNRRGISTFA